MGETIIMLIVLKAILEYHVRPQYIVLLPVLCLRISDELQALTSSKGHARVAEAVRR